MKKQTYLLIAVFTLFILGCGPQFVRGSDKPDLDEYAMSTGLDKLDLEKLFDENIESLMNSGAVSRWKIKDPAPIVSLFPILNETSEHVRDQLDALLQKMETKLVNSGVATVVDRARQDALIAEVKKQQGADFDSSHAAQVGRQLGAGFFLTGKVYDSAEKHDGERRVQYFLFMEVVDVETGAIVWKNESNLTKGLVK